MKQRRVGVSGLRVSDLGLGTATWGSHVTRDDAASILRTFTAHGGTLVDSSPAYAAGTSQEMLGAVLADAAVDREDLVLSSSAGVAPHSPVGHRVDCSRRALMRQLDRTLTALGTDHLDLWSVGYWDEKTPPAEVADTLDWAVRTGRARYAGVRDYSGWQLAVTHAAMTGPALVAAQREYSLLVRGIEEEVIPAAGHLGVGVLAAAPLAHGVLPGRYRSTGQPAGARAEIHALLGTTSDVVVDAVTTAAEGLGLPPAVVALAWVRDRPGVAAAVVGPSSPTQAEELFRLGGTVLPRAIIKALDDVSR
ncbi:aldo/keto reductase [Corynebacterium suedekumii]|uniref:Aldo/keto reductase n=1 Tax=Corynebacterium suedekumii TaxID=3049801 RepID=A0ABY8VJD3_9CORY|nr:aldo/keto reductase [Corynebacterium suedekumii]WIM69750.1 aldo/keto reductase [Corynebacterium suedekumii]